MLAFTGKASKYKVKLTKCDINTTLSEKDTLWLKFLWITVILRPFDVTTVKWQNDILSVILHVEECWGLKEDFESCAFQKYLQSAVLFSLVECLPLSQTSL